MHHIDKRERSVLVNMHGEVGRAGVRDVDRAVPPGPFTVSRVKCGEVSKRYEARLAGRTRLKTMNWIRRFLQVWWGYRAYLPGVARRSFSRGEKVELKVNALRSASTQMSREYYSYAYCRPPKILESAQSLGQELMGDRDRVNSPYALYAGEDEECVKVCEVELSASEAAAFREAIEDEYSHEWIIDNLPAVSEEDGPEYVQVGSRIPVGRKAGYVLYNHALIRISTDSGGRVTEFAVESSSRRDTCAGPEVAVAAGARIPFTYSVEWRPTSVAWSELWELVWMLSGRGRPARPLAAALFSLAILVGLVTTSILRKRPPGVEEDMQKEANLVAAVVGAGTPDMARDRRRVRAPNRRRRLARDARLASREPASSLRTCGLARRLRVRAMPQDPRRARSSRRRRPLRDRLSWPRPRHFRRHKYLGRVLRLDHRFAAQARAHVARALRRPPRPRSPRSRDRLSTTPAPPPPPRRRRLLSRRPPLRPPTLPRPHRQLPPRPRTRVSFAHLPSRYYPRALARLHHRRCLRRPHRRRQPPFPRRSLLRRRRHRTLRLALLRILLLRRARPQQLRDDSSFTLASPRPPTSPPSPSSPSPSLSPLPPSASSPLLSPTRARPPLPRPPSLLRCAAASDSVDRPHVSLLD